MQLRLAIHAVLVVAVSACASTPPPPPPSADPAVEHLKRSATEIKEAWAVLASVERAKAPDSFVPEHVASEIVAAPKLSTLLTLSMAGDAEDVLRAVAKHADIDLNIIGARPATALPVFVTVEEARTVDVVRDIAFQVGAAAEVRVRNLPDQEFIELRYASAR